MVLPQPRHGGDAVERAACAGRSRPRPGRARRRARSRPGRSRPRRRRSARAGSRSAACSDSRKRASSSASRTLTGAPAPLPACRQGHVSLASVTVQPESPVAYRRPARPRAGPARRRHGAFRDPLRGSCGASADEARHRGRTISATSPRPFPRRRDGRRARALPAADPRALRQRREARRAGATRRRAAARARRRPLGRARHARRHGGGRTGPGGAVWIDAHGDLNTPRDLAERQRARHGARGGARPRRRRVRATTTGRCRRSRREARARRLPLARPGRARGAEPARRQGVHDERGRPARHRDVHARGARARAPAPRSCTSRSTWTSSIPTTRPASARRCAAACRTARRTSRWRSSPSPALADSLDVVEVNPSSTARTRRAARRRARRLRARRADPLAARNCSTASAISSNAAHITMCLPGTRDERVLVLLHVLVAHEPVVRRVQQQRRRLRPAAAARSRARRRSRSTAACDVRRRTRPSGSVSTCSAMSSIARARSMPAASLRASMYASTES